MGLPKHRPDLPRRCRWRDGEGVRCPLLQEPELTCCLAHRCQGSRSCPRRATDGRLTCRSHRRLENQLQHRREIGAVGRTSGRSSPATLPYLGPLPSWEELLKRWGKERAEQGKAFRKIHGPRSPIRPVKPRDSALTCAWHDEIGVRCRKKATPPRTCCDQHRCQGDPDCPLRAVNATTLCRHHRRIAGRLKFRHPQPPLT